MKAIPFRGIFPLNPVADYINDPIQNPPVIYTRYSVHQEQNGSIHDI